jgi:hypothetical protein
MGVLAFVFGCVQDDRQRLQMSNACPIIANLRLPVARKYVAMAQSCADHVRINQNCVAQGLTRPRVLPLFGQSLRTLLARGTGASSKAE